MNNIAEHLMDTLEHKKWIIEASTIMVQYLIEQDREDDALALSKRCALHDNSKLEREELSLFSKLPLERTTLKNPKENISVEIKDIISVHWRKNRHHPEHFDDYHSMNEIDIMEMVCDWFARSLQYDTDFMDFVETRQQIRFHFDDDFYKKVYDYCCILNNNVHKLKK